MNITGFELSKEAFPPMDVLTATATPVTVRQEARQAAIIIPDLCTSSELLNTGKRDEVSDKIAVIEPATMKVHVAKMDLDRNAEMPQTPCPDVQPLPVVVPKPTKKPAITKREIGSTFQT
jgi:hypothetical protein